MSAGSCTGKIKIRPFFTLLYHSVIFKMQNRRRFLLYFFFVQRVTRVTTRNSLLLRGIARLSNVVLLRVHYELFQKLLRSILHIMTPLLRKKSTMHYASKNHSEKLLCVLQVCLSLETESYSSRSVTFFIFKANM